MFLCVRLRACHESGATPTVPPATSRPQWSQSISTPPPPNLAINSNTVSVVKVRPNDLEHKAYLFLHGQVAARLLIFPSIIHHRAVLGRSRAVATGSQLRDLFAVAPVSVAGPDGATAFPFEATAKLQVTAIPTRSDTRPWSSEITSESLVSTTFCLCHKFHPNHSTSTAKKDVSGHRRAKKNIKKGKAVSFLDRLSMIDTLDRQSCLQSAWRPFELFK